MSVEIGLSDDVAACQALRHAVFCVEQGVSLAEEQDGRDGEAHHILACAHDAPVGAARILISGVTGKIGRVCVLAEHRGQGLGAGLVRACLAHLWTCDGVTRAELGAQTHALAFYKALGFAPIGPEYIEINTPHQTMERVL